MTQLLQRYVAESGNPIDWPALDFHTIAAFLTVPMRVGSILTQSQLPAYVEYLSWYLGCCRAAIEVLADVCGVALAPVADVEPVETPDRSEEQTSELQSLMRLSYAGFCMKQTQTKST